MKKIILFTSNTCPHCHTAKTYLRENDISFEEKNISSDLSARRELINRGIKGVPTFIIGDEVVVGFDADKIKRLLDYIITDCSQCNTKLRIPKGKGKITVSCPNCKSEFKTTT